MWFFPISTGFSIIDIPLMIFAIWFFVHLYRKSNKKPKEWEPTPEQREKWEEEARKRTQKWEEFKKWREGMGKWMEENKISVEDEEPIHRHHHRRKRKSRRRSRYRKMSDTYFD